MKAITGLKGTSYEEKLKELNMPSLLDRRKEMWFERADIRRVTRNNAVRHNLVPKRGQHEYRRNFFSLRVIEEWNSLPVTVRDAPTVSSFKRQYRRHLEAMAAPNTPAS